MISFRERNPVVVGIISIVLITTGIYLAFSINRFEGLRGVYLLRADLEDAAGLQAGNEVRVAGVKVGQVTDIELVPGAARITMEVKEDTRLPAETRLEVKLKTLLGQKFIDLQLPRAYLEAASGGGDPSGATDRYLADGALIPKSQTSIPFEIHQAATEGTAVLEEIDKRALRRMIGVLAGTAETSADELGRLFVSVNKAGEVLRVHNDDIRALVRDAARVTGTLGASDQEIENILSRSAELLEVLADRRANTSSLLEATNFLALDLGVLLGDVGDSIAAGTGDLDSLLAVVEQEMASLDAALTELGTAQEMFGQQITFGRFIEGHICAITTEDTCVPEGSPEEPGIPVKGQQPQFTSTRGAQ